MEDEPAFKLRCELHGHQDDVRAVTVGGPGVITSSRDTTIKVWAEEGPTAYSCVQTLTGHAKYVAAVAYAPPGLLPDAPNGAIVSGSFDGVVMLWDAATAAVLATLRGHQYQVTALALLPSGDVASSSVDKTIILWRGGKQAAKLEGHEGPVLCLAVTEGGELLSGSGDHTLRRWAGGSCVSTYKGHTDTVRGVAVLPGVGFVSASHDCSLRVWSLAGEVLAELMGHTAIIYSVAATAQGLVASGSEDNTARLWRASGECLQAIDHPGCVWGVAFTPQGDLATACSDAVARLWSSAPERQAGDEASTALREAIERRRASAAGGGGGAAGAGGAMDVDGAAGAGAAGGGLPPGVKVAEAFELAQPGSKDGETKLVREADGGVSAYGWDAKGCTWEKIGTVVDAPEPGSISSGRRWHMGREWDHVFDVEMDSGLKLKLALDEGENPYLAADRFLEQHDLPPEFKEQVVKFILDNTGAGRPGAAALADLPITGGFCDPFTGGAGDRPPPRGALPAAAAAPPGSFDITGGGVDPFTGGGGGRGAPAAAPAAASAPPQLPARAFLLFDAPPPAAPLRSKLLEFSGALAAAGGAAPDALITDAEAAPGGALDRLLACLAPTAAGAGAAAPAVPDDALALLSRLLRWPAAQLFPALDAARCAALDAGAAARLAAGAGSLSAPAPGALSGALAAAAVSGLGPALQTALRLACNLFKQPALREWAAANRGQLLDGFSGCGGAGKGVRLSLATLLLNYAVASAAAEPGAAGGGGGGGDSEEGRMQLLSALEELLGGLPADEAEAAARALAALGTLLVAGGAELSALAADLGLPDQLGRFDGAAAGAPKLAATLAEVRALLQRR